MSESIKLKMNIIHIEGADGSGKTTLVKELKQRLIQDRPDLISSFYHYPSFNPSEFSKWDATNGEKFMMFMSDFQHGEVNTAMKIATTAALSGPIDNNELDVVIVIDRSFLSTATYQIVMEGLKEEVRGFSNHLQNANNLEYTAGVVCKLASGMWSDKVLGRNGRFEVESKHLIVLLEPDPKIAAERVVSRDGEAVDEIDAMSLEEAVERITKLQYAYRIAIHGAKNAGFSTYRVQHGEGFEPSVDEVANEVSNAINIIFKKDLFQCS